MKRFLPWMLVTFPAIGILFVGVFIGLADGVKPQVEVPDLVAEFILMATMLIWLHFAAILQRRQTTYWIFISGVACLVWLMVIKMVSEFSLHEPLTIQIIEAGLTVSGVILLSAGIVAWSRDYRALIDEAEKKQQQYRHMSYTDALTGIGNRAAYDRKVKHFSEDQTPYVLLLADVDFFKQVNDQYGHEVGDKALQHVAKTIEQNSRGANECFRIGGEEFAVLLDECSQQQACAIAERIRSAIETNSMEVDQLALNLTISIGLCISRSNETPQTTYRHADTALYQAKQNGRNQVVFSA